MIETRQLTKAFKNTNAVDHADMKIEENRIYGLVGENGAGKTTLIRMLAGLVFPTSGEMIINGKSDEKGLAQERKKMSFIVETPYYRPDLTALENLEMQQISCGIKEEASYLEELLEFVGLSDTGNKKTGNFSLGMRQRLGIAAAMVSKPKTLFLDEPINGLDPVGIIQMRELISKLHNEFGATIVISSHILSELYQSATDYIFIHRGKIIEQISKDRLDEACSEKVIIGTNNPEKAAVLLKENFSVTNVDISNENGNIKIDSKAFDIAKAVKVLVYNGVLIDKAYKKKRSLEEYFLTKIIGKGKV